MPSSPFRHRTLLYQDCYPRDHEAVPWVGHHDWYWSGITVDKIWVGPPTLLLYLLEGCGQNWRESDKEKDHYIAMQLRQDERSMTSSMWSMIKAMRAFTTFDSVHDVINARAEMLYWTPHWITESNAVVWKHLSIGIQSLQLRAFPCYSLSCTFHSILC